MNILSLALVTTVALVSVTASVIGSQMISSRFESLDCGYPNGAELEGAEFSRLPADSRTECVIACIGDDACVAVNYHPELRLCALLATDANIDCMNLQPADGVFYIQAANLCGTSFTWDPSERTCVPVVVPTTQGPERTTVFIDMRTDYDCNKNDPCTPELLATTPWMRFSYAGNPSFFMECKPTCLLTKCTEAGTRWNQALQQCLA